MSRLTRLRRSLTRALYMGVLLGVLLLGLWEARHRWGPEGPPPSLQEPIPLTAPVSSPHPGGEALPVSGGETLPLSGGESLPVTAPPPDLRSWERWTYHPVATDPAMRPRISAAAAILVEPTTMTVLYAHNEHERRAPASTTKIMTALVALERGRLQDGVTVSRRAARIGGSSLHLRPGQEILLGDLIHGLLMRSGNDAAVAIAEHVAGSEREFVHLMNRRARELGAANTRFQNPHGLDHPDHFSTAFDLAHLARLAMTFPTFKDIVARREYAPPGSHRPWRNTNRLLWGLEGAEGVKTGTTGRAGNCLVAAASRDEMQLISVVLHSGDRWHDSGLLLEWGFGSFERMTLAQGGKAVVEVPIPRATGPLRAGPLQDLTAVVHRREIPRVRVDAQLGSLTLPVRKGQAVGWARIWVGGELRRQVPLVAHGDVDRWTPLRALWRWFTDRFSGRHGEPN